MRRQERALPEVARLRLREEESRIDRREDAEREAQDGEGSDQTRSEDSEHEVDEEDERVRGENEGALHEPAPPLRAREDQIEERRPFQIEDEEESRQRQECAADDRRSEPPEDARRRE